jgi:hypothetical protein
MRVEGRARRTETRRPLLVGAIAAIQMQKGTTIGNAIVVCLAGAGLSVLWFWACGVTGGTRHAARTRQVPKRLVVAQPPVDGTPAQGVGLGYDVAIADTILVVCTWGAAEPHGVTGNYTRRNSRAHDNVTATYPSASDVPTQEEGYSWISSRRLTVTPMTRQHSNSGTPSKTG